MGTRKGSQSWTISDELWEKVKGYIPERGRDPEKVYKHALAKAGTGFQPGRCWKGYYMFCGQGASGRQCLKNMGAEAVFIDIFKNGRQQDSSRKSGEPDWWNMMNWKGLAGSGRVLTAA